MLIVLWITVVLWSLFSLASSIVKSLLSLLVVFVLLPVYFNYFLTLFVKLTCPHLPVVSNIHSFSSLPMSLLFFPLSFFQWSNSNFNKRFGRRLWCRWVVLSSRTMFHGSYLSRFLVVPFDFSLSSLLHLRLSFLSLSKYFLSVVAILLLCLSLPSSIRLPTPFLSQAAATVICMREKSQCQANRQALTWEKKTEEVLPKKTHKGKVSQKGDRGMR